MFSLIVVLYVASNLACMAAYGPQIVRLWKSEEARSHVPVSTWWVWSLGGLTEGLYAIRLEDGMALFFMALCHTAACGWIAGIASLHQWRARPLPSAQKPDASGILSAKGRLEPLGGAIASGPIEVRPEVKIAAEAR